MSVIAQALLMSVRLGGGAMVQVGATVPQPASIRELPARYASRDHGIIHDRVIELTLAAGTTVVRDAVIGCTQPPWAGSWLVLTIERSDAVCQVVRAKQVVRKVAAKGSIEVAS